MKIKKVTVVTEKTIPVTKKIKVTEKVEVFEISMPEIISAFLKWRKATKGTNAEIYDHAFSDEQNSVVDANEFVHFLKEK